MIIAILAFEITLVIQLGILLGIMWPRKVAPTGGWIPPKKAESLEEDDTVIVMDDRREQQWKDENVEPEL